MRHGDFKDQCNQTPINDCFAPLSVIQTRVDEVQKELGARPQFQTAIGTPIELPVIMTSDERDPAWWDAVRARGWKFIDHGPDGEDTVAKLGRWCVFLPPLHWFRLNQGFVHAGIQYSSTR